MPPPRPVVAMLPRIAHVAAHHAVAQMKRALIDKQAAAAVLTAKCTNKVGLSLRITQPGIVATRQCEAVQYDHLFFGVHNRNRAAVSQRINGRHVV